MNQLPSAAAARAEFSEELSNSRGHDDENSAQKTVLISGLGDGAFYAADGPAIGLTGLRGNFVISIGLVGRQGRRDVGWRWPALSGEWSG